jgi:hypothetical protein
VKQRLSWLALYAVTMAYLESAVVVYLRALYYPDGFAFPLVALPSGMIAIEVGREASTLIMLLATAALAGRDPWERFLAFNVAFGVWDVFYYVWLWLFLGWPPSLFTWDLLFLIPVPWLGPVLAPLIVSTALITVSLWLWRLDERGARVRFSRGHWVSAIAGGVLVLVSFMIDFQSAVDLRMPAPFRWDLFLVGVGMALAAVVRGYRRSLRSS